MFRLKSFLEDEKQILEKTEGVIGTIDLMKKSVLAKAFRGELGTNNPEEQSAIEVLKTIHIETKKQTDILLYMSLNILINELIQYYL